MSYGFVYVLGNPAMPGIYKIGFTDRAPSSRCEELSKSTAVPMPFELLFAAEVMDAETAERELHADFSEFRVNPSREFFRLEHKQLIDIRDTLEGRSHLYSLLVGFEMAEMEFNAKNAMEITP